LRSKIPSTTSGVMMSSDILTRLFPMCVALRRKCVQ
jgi:hypothetical protein